MRKKTMLLLFISSTLAVYNPYEDASSPEYPTLFSEFRSFVIKVLIANLRRKEKVRFKPATTSCENRCGEMRSHTTYCHCDADCQIFQDCCYDYLKICKPNTTVENAELEKWQCVSDLHHQHVIHLPWYDIPAKLPRIKGHTMISSCLNYSRERKENCTNPGKLPHDNIDTGNIPVEGPDGNTYKNRYCALGHGINSKSIKSWGFELLCNTYVRTYNNTEKIQEVVNNCIKEESKDCLQEHKAYLENNCTWYYAPPLNITKKSTVCSPVKICPQTPVINMTASKYTQLRLKCQAYMRIVCHNGSYYKNFHCALCHGIEPTDVQNCPIPIYVPTISIFFEIPETKPNRYKEATTKYVNPTVNKEATIKYVNTTENKEASIKYVNTTVTKNNGSNPAELGTTELTLEIYFNLIGLSVSMVTLLLLLALYSLVKALRTTPGKIIIGLSTSILAYQTLLLVTPKFNDKAVTCNVIAVFLHFAILTSFAWMNVMSFDVWKTFGKSDQQPIRKKSSAFLHYSFYVFINPVLIVTTCIALDRSGIMLVYWREGASSSCWIVNNLANILFFKVPVGVSLGLNIIAFIWTIFGITTVRNKTMKYNSTKNRHTITKNMKMYGKLSVVMGFTWTLGFGMEYSVVLRFIYLIVNSLQGFFIFLAFVTNKRVMEKCKLSRASWSQTQGTWLSARKISSGSRVAESVKPSSGRI